MTPAEDLKEKVADLQTKLIAAHPQLPILLRTIHTQLRADPELTTTLSEEEIGVLVSGLKLQTRTEITTAVVKSASTSKKALSKLGVDDL